MEKYRLGHPIREFAHELPPKKTIRGYVPFLSSTELYSSIPFYQMGAKGSKRKTDTLSTDKGKKVIH
jgi:hypothetical protein